MPGRCEYWRPKGPNTAGACFPQIDSIAEEASRTIDDTKRNALLADAQQKLTDLAPCIFILDTRETAGMSRKLQGAILTVGSTLTVDENSWLEA